MRWLLTKKVLAMILVVAHLTGNHTVMAVIPGYGLLV